jgi:nitroreductase
MSGNNERAVTTKVRQDEGPSEVLESLLRDRHACRGFRPTPVPRAILERILAMAQWTASWCNTQPWRVVITSGAATERLREALSRQAATTEPLAPDFPFPAEYPGVHDTRRREMALQLYDACGIARGDRAASRAQTLENFRFFGAPHLAVVTSERTLGVYGAIDCGGYIGNLMLAARSVGVSTIAQAAIAAYAPLVRCQLGLPESRRIVCGISMGYEDEDHPANGFRTPRAPLEETATWLDE